jgi:hypothetical protein
MLLSFATIGKRSSVLAVLGFCTTLFRGTCYGTSAALGKTGAAIGTQVFKLIQLNLGKRWIFIIAAICDITGILVTYFFVPNITGEDLSKNDERFRAYFVHHGWDGEIGEGELKAPANNLNASISESNDITEKAR